MGHDRISPVGVPFLGAPHAGVLYYIGQPSTSCWKCHGVGGQDILTHSLLKVS